MSVTKLMVSLVCPAVDCIMEEGKKDSRYKTEESEMWQAETLLHMHMQSSHAIDHAIVLSEHVYLEGVKTYGVRCLYSCGWVSHPWYPSYHVAMSRLYEHDAAHHTSPVKNITPAEEIVMKCNMCGFQTRGTKRRRLRKRLDMHRKLCEAAMDTVTVVEQQGDYLDNSVLESLRKAEVAVNKFLESNPSLMKRLDKDKHQKVREAAMDKVVEQEDLMENSMFKCLSEADIIAGNFLRSEHIPDLRGRQMSEELQSLGVNEIPELQVGDIRRAE